MALTAAGVAGLCLVLWLVLHLAGDLREDPRVPGAGRRDRPRRVHRPGARPRRHLAGAPDRHVTAWALGVALPAALFLVLAIFLIHDLHPKNGASRRTAYIALGVGALLVAGVTGIPALAPVASALQSLPANIAGFVNTL